MRNKNIIFMVLYVLCINNGENVDRIKIEICWLNVYL